MVTDPKDKSTNQPQSTLSTPNVDNNVDPRLHPMGPSRNPKRNTVRQTTIQDMADDIWQDSAMADLTKDRVRTCQMEDEFCRDLIQYLESDILPNTARRQRKCLLREMDYCLSDDGLLHHLWSPIPTSASAIYMRLVVPTALQDSVISAVHSSTLGAHVGIQKVMHTLRQRFTFPGMFHKVRTFVNNCDACLRAKTTHKAYKIPRTLYEMAELPMERLHIDFAGPLALSHKGNRYFVTVVDAMSGYLICWPARNITTESFARRFFSEVICKYGCPKKCTSDKGSQFTSKVWAEIGKIMGIKMTTTSPFSPSSNGRAEVKNRDIVNLLRSLTSSQPKRWCEYIPAATFALNNTIHSGTSLTPFNVLFGRDATIPSDAILQGHTNPKPMFEVVGDMLSFQKRAYGLA